MNSKRLTVAIFLLSISTSLFAWDENWTAEVSKITVYENEAADIFISSPRNGPQSNLDCYGANNIVHLGVKDSPAPKAMLSQALAIYVSNKTIRFGIRRVDGGFCEVEYITAM